jgi:alpha-glucosidase
MIEIDNVEVSFDINTLEMSGYLIVDKEFTALHISGE